MGRVYRDPGFGRDNFEEKRVRGWGVMNVECSAPAAQRPPSFLHTEEDSSESCPRYPLMDIEQ